jgi:hypothetical protein
MKRKSESSEFFALPARKKPRLIHEIPTEIWLPILETAFNNYLTQEKLWGIRIYKGLSRVAKATERLASQPVINVALATDPQIQLQKHIDEQLKDGDRFIPHGFCIDTDAPSAIQRQKEVYNLAFSLSVSCTALYECMSHNTIWKPILELTVGAREWLGVNPGAIQYEFQGSYKQACKFLMTFGYNKPTLGEVAFLTTHTDLTCNQGEVAFMKQKNGEIGITTYNLNTKKQMALKKIPVAHKVKKFKKYGPIYVFKQGREFRIFDSLKNTVTNITPDGNYKLFGCLGDNVFVYRNNGYQIDVLKTDVEYWANEESQGLGKPLLLGGLPIILWFTGVGPVEIFLFDEEKKKIRYAMPILVRHMVTKRFSYNLIKETSSRIFYLDPHTKKIAEYNPITFERLSEIPVENTVLNKTNFEGNVAKNPFMVLGNFAIVKHTKGEITKWFIFDIRSGKQINTWKVEQQFFFAGSKLISLDVLSVSQYSLLENTIITTAEECARKKKGSAENVLDEENLPLPKTDQFVKMLVE